MTAALVNPDPTHSVRADPGGWLDGAPSVLALPADRPRPTTLSVPLQRLQLRVPAATTAALRSLAERCETDLSAVLLAALRVLVARTADEQDVVLGHGTSAPGQEAGDAVLVVRAAVAMDDGMADAVRTTAAARADALARGARTVDELVAELGLEPGPGKHPVFQIGFVDGMVPDGSWPRSSPVPPDLVLGWRQDDDELALDLCWSPELFDRGRMERFGGHLLQLLAHGAEDPAGPVALLPLMTADEVAELDRWNATAQEHDADVPLAKRFLQQVDATPDATAVEDAGLAMTYRELADRAAALARSLRAAGVEPDVTVAVCAERSVEMVVGVVAVLMAGGAYVPVDPAYPAGRREFMITDSGARVLLTQSGLRHVVPTGYEGAVVLLDQPVHDPDPGGVRPAGRSGRDLGYVIYTSGSTGQPKAVSMPQSALDNLVAWQLRRPQFVQGARTLQFSSLSFDVSFQEIFTTWCSGGTLVLVDEATRRDPLRLLGHLVQHRVERIFLPNVALRGLASAVASSGDVPTTLREVYTAGEQLQVDPVMRALFQRLPAAVLENQYGPSESHVVTAHTLAGAPSDWPVLPPIGGPVDNSQVHVLDSRLQRRPVGVPGELYLGGGCLARGYLHRPDLTDERFIPAPASVPDDGRLYRTGDLARWLPSGEVEFLGRLDHQVKFRGYRIEPGEVGAVLSAAPGVEQCIAVVRAVDAGPRLTAYLVPSAREPDLAAVHRYAKEALPGYMVPSHYLVVHELPLTSSGKVDTAALPDAAFDRGILATSYQAPSSRTEEALADIWSTLLGIPDIGVLDDFFELGGDSLLAAEMAERVAESLGREMPLGALAQAPTVAGLARLLSDEGDESLYSCLVPLQLGATGVTPLFIVHGGSGNVATFPVLARALPPDQPVYALQWDGFGGGRGRRRVESMARRYLREVREVQPSGPYVLAGQCIGGLVAREMTRLLLSKGEQVALLVMYDSPNLASAAYVRGPSLRERLGTSTGRRTAAFEAARAVYRRRPWRNDPVGRGREAMHVAAWRHRPRPLPASVPTHWVGSGEWDGKRIALDGHWTDGAMGWAADQSPSFVVHRLQGDHNEVLYDPAAVQLLRSALELAHREIADAR